MHRIVLNIDPRELPTAQQKGYNHTTGRIYTKAHVQRAQNLLFWSLRRAPLFPDSTGAFGVRITYDYEPPKAQRHAHGTPKTTRPDCDNLTKLILDVITKTQIAYEDDSQIAMLIQTKRFTPKGEAPKISIDIWKL